MLYEGNNIFHFGDESIPVEGTTLLFFNPSTPYSYEPLTPDTKGFFCVFKEEFFAENLRISLPNLPLFKPNAKPIFKISNALKADIYTLFEKIKKEIDSDFSYKSALIQSYVSQIVYSALKYEPLQVKPGPTDANARITSVFLELLERQFPVKSIDQNFIYRKPAHFADQLAVHVNYLNRALKKVTGKTTTEHIAERTLAEAKALLKHTHWNIAEISIALGYEDQSHFNSFFKKHTHYSPSEYRNI
nr:AraC family transcriptional regulator [Fulvivirga sediminis]